MTEWRRCSEESPPKDGLYLVWCASLDPEKPFRFIGWWHSDLRRFDLVVEYWGEAIVRQGYWAPYPEGPA